MLHFPNAKINIGLFVTEKRPDGYHNIETIFYPLPMLKDALEVVEAQDDQESSIVVSGKAIDGNPLDNLVWKAYQILKSRYPDVIRSIKIRLLKSIPMGAGLGGGSADGAFMLRLLNKFFELGLNDLELAELALQLGSDCPFFVYNTPQYAMGRGEVLSSIAVDLSEYSIQVVCPKIHVSTASAFSKIVPKPSVFSLKEINQLPISEWRNQIVNDFEAPVFEIHPQLAKIKEQLYASSAHFASMSGSGSSLYGIFPKGKFADIEQNEFQDSFYFE